MKKLILMFVMLFSCTTFSNAASLTVTIDNIESDSGEIYVQIFKGMENYQNNVAEDQTILAAKKGTNQLIFNNLTSGEYVVRLFHDQNNNQTFDQDINGIPMEGYAFSNEAMGMFGPPSYRDMVVIINDNNVTANTKAKMTY